MGLKPNSAQFALRCVSLTTKETRYALDTQDAHTLKKCNSRLDATLLTQELHDVTTNNVTRTLIIGCIGLTYWFGSIRLSR